MNKLALCGLGLSLSCCVLSTELEEGRLPTSALYEALTALPNKSITVTDDRRYYRLTAALQNPEYLALEVTITNITSGGSVCYSDGWRDGPLDGKIDKTTWTMPLFDQHLSFQRTAVYRNLMSVLFTSLDSKK